MRPIAAFLSLLLLAATASRAELARAADPASTPDHPRAEAPVTSYGDLFPGAGHPTVSAATGLPFLAIGEVGIGVTNGFAIGVVGGITPSVLTAGIRPRLRLPTSRHTSLVLAAPILYYPKASAPGPGNIGSDSWVLTRTELLLDGELSDRWHLAGGMGFIAAASTTALGQLFQGREFAMPPYDGSTESKRGFAGGIWNTVCARTSYAMSPSSHLFAESSLVMAGFVPASGVGGPPIVVTLGAQHSF
jgi:hypothetical protein